MGTVLRCKPRKISALLHEMSALDGSPGSRARSISASEILSRNAKLMVKARDQIGDSAIRDILKRTEDTAGSWKDASTDDYSAGSSDGDGSGEKAVSRSDARVPCQTLVQ